MLALAPKEHWMSSWPARQCLLVAAPPPEEACVYVLANRLDAYAGITATSKAQGDRGGYVPLGQRVATGSTW